MFVFLLPLGLLYLIDKIKMLQPTALPLSYRGIDLLIVKAQDNSKTTLLGTKNQENAGLGLSPALIIFDGFTFVLAVIGEAFFLDNVAGFRVLENINHPFLNGIYNILVAPAVANITDTLALGQSAALRRASR